MVIYKGFLSNADPYSIETSYDPAFGRTVTERYAGTRAELESRFTSIENAGSEYYMTGGRGPYYDLSVTYRIQETDVVRWELSREVLEKDIFNFPTFAAEMVLGGGGVYRDAIETAARSGSGLPTSPIDYSDAGTYPRAPEILELLQQGQTHYETSYLVLRHSRFITGATGPVPLRVYEKEYVFSTAQLGLPADIKFSVPATPAAVDTPPGHRWGWRIRGASSVWEGVNVTQTHEFVWAAWSSAIYPDAPAGYSPT